MTYEETLQFMFSQLPMYQKIGGKAFKKSLGNIVAFCEFLGNPQEKFKSIHVAGTNGKGSSSHMLSAVLQAAGYKTGLYTSPHLKNFTERIRIDGQEIGREAVVAFIERTKAFIEEVRPSFFEMTVAMAFDYFAQEQVDYAVVEVGLGGRLDSTNIIQPEICLITNISYDHANMLGETLPEIAGEKAGIIKAEIPVVVSQYQEEVAHVFEEKAKEKKAKLTFASKQFRWNKGNLYQHDELLYEALSLPLHGVYQMANVIGVIAAAQQLGIPKDTIQKGIQQMSDYIVLKGRWQLLGVNPKVLCDVGHNEAGVSMIMDDLMRYAFDQLHIVWGMVKDKDHEKILKMLPKDAHYYFCKPNVPRGMDVELLYESAKALKLEGQSYNSVNEAIRQAKEKASRNDFIFIGGSTFVVAEIDDL